MLANPDPNRPKLGTLWPSGGDLMIGHGNSSTCSCLMKRLLLMGLTLSEDRRG
jgi:hypothetical protein